jgi:hypothetical protein
VWKASIYTAATVVFLYLEPLVTNLFRGAGFYASHARAWQEMMLPHTWANVIWLTMLLVVFVSAMELTRALGKDELRSLYFGADRVFAKNRLRKAA